MKVGFSSEAEDDLFSLRLYITEQSGLIRADNYIDRIERYCLGFANSPHRGTMRDDIYPGLRIVGFERRVTIGFHLEVDMVVIDRVLYGGREFD